MKYHEGKSIIKSEEYNILNCEDTTMLTIPRENPMQYELKIHESLTEVNEN